MRYTLSTDTGTALHDRGSMNRSKADNSQSPAAPHDAPGRLASAKPALTLAGFLSITAAMVLSVHEYPTFAVAGMQIPFFLLASGLLWFLPVAVCSAEMATVKGWEDGGIFSWVGGMLGTRFGFAAVFFQWFQITICFVIIIYFGLSALSYLLDFPALNSDPLVKTAGVLAVFWLVSFLQLGGTKRTAVFAKFGFILGVLAPTVLLLAFSALYVASGKPLQLDFGDPKLLPDFTQVSTLVVFVSFLFANMGAEASASHINELKNPTRDYPLAMILLVIAATVLNAIGGFAVAGAVPLDQLSMSGGMVQTFETLILAVGPDLGWLVKALCAMLVVGVIGEVGSWVVGPSRALYAVAERGLLPERLKKLNRHGAPVPLIIMQGIVVSAWAAVLTLEGGGDNLSYLAAVSLTAVIYLVAYLMLFISYTKLILRPDMQRGYHVPGKTAGKWIFSIVGLATSLFALIIAFFPPVVIAASQQPAYEALLAAGFVVTLLLPFIIYAAYGRKHECEPETKPRHVLAREVNRFARLSGRGEHLLPGEGEQKQQHPES